MQGNTMTTPDSFASKAALVTGGGGIVQAVALDVARHGAAVAVTWRRSDPLEQTVEQIQALGAQSAVPGAGAYAATKAGVSARPDVGHTQGIGRTS
jgi:NAD(P)-dependent dehydrogenase (short-subunit alcohol dehydrogenase family)